MALAHPVRTAIRATPLERAALGAASRLAEFVAWRMQRRHESLESAIVQRTARMQAQSAREDAVTRAHSLGLLR